MTHAKLVKHAEAWLLNTKGCAFVFTELVTYVGETPDAIGFRDMGVSMLVECKVSRSDFMADINKHHRKEPAAGMGSYRFYMCPEGLLKPEDLPPRWGLVYVYEGGRKRQIVGPKGNILYSPNCEAYQFPEKNSMGETMMMMSALRRLHIRGLLKTIYSNRRRKYA
jgi:hypothetical protein